MSDAPRVTVEFTSALRNFFPALRRCEVRAHTVRDAVQALEALHPGLGAYLLEDHGALRHHVNIFVDNDLIADRQKLSDPLRQGASVFIVQALSGG
ncbi:MAG: MoaD/ThiS family protein [Myxococcales bacterium]|nr:MoaD/ThiS family protein [Myxococcales bacterium]